jgi:deazaflavin-dependent oxidoreductase (nitroreductase family)
MSAMIGLSLFVYRVLGNRMRVMGRPLLLLETVGARSGRKRFAIIGWFPDTTKASRLVVASYAGSARHPAWFLNLAKHPDRVWVEIAKQRFKVRPELLKGVDRMQAWERIVSLAPGYGNYQTKTDREIPIVRLKRIENS